jgi:short-subunit dehydrogenase
VPRSIAVFGAGPGLGLSVARRYANEGYRVVLVARRPEPLSEMAAGLASGGVSVHVIPADLSDIDAIPALSEQVRDRVGELDALYYGPATGHFIPAADLTPQDVQSFMSPCVYSLVALVGEFLPHMLTQRDGAILVPAGGSAVRGVPNFSGPGLALAAQRNYLQSLHGEVTDKGVYVGRLYIGWIIKNSEMQARIAADVAAGRTTLQRPLVDPDVLADLLWTMHNTTRQPEATCPENLFDRQLLSAT